MIGLGNSVVKRKLGGGPPAAPVNVSQPFLVGTGEVGTVVTCNRGSWSGSPSPTYTYDFRIDSISVQNTSSNSYTPVIADNGKTLTCLVTATNPLGSASEGTSNSKIIGTAPVNTVLPTLDVTGNQVIGTTTITATDGTWTGSSPITFEYRWTRNGIPISGETTNTYTLQPADESATIRVQVRGVNSYATSAYVTSDDSVVGGYAPVNTALPVMNLSGNQLVGQIIGFTTEGTWTGTPTVTLQYRWLRNGSPIGGAINNTYTLVAADDGATITAQVRGTNAWGTSAYSTSSNSINAGTAPVNLVAPTVTPSGTQSTDAVITVNVGTWSGTPTILYAYRWTRNGTPISGATASTYTIQVADDGTTIRCEVQGSNAFGTSAFVASSNSVSAVNAIAPVNTVAPVISGTAVVGQTLSSTTGTWDGIPTPTYSYQWRRNGVDIGSATSSTYTLVSADAGNNITCRVTATNSAGSTNATSNTLAILATVLDLYPNAAAAYSVRLLRGAYLSSPAIRVRRSNDNTEQDIGFTTTGELDTSALSSFVGSNNGFVVRWYDQSTNGRNAINTTPANQPQIVSSGSVIIQGTKPIIQFTTSDFLRTSTTFSMGVNRTYLMTLFNAINTSGSYKGYFCHTPTNYTDNNINGILGRFGTSNTPSSYVGSGTANTSIGNTPLATNQYFLLNALVQGGVQHQIYRNGVLNDQNLSLTINPENTARNLDIMFHPEAGNNLRTNECIVWESYQSTNRTNIESNVNTYYGIY